MREREERRNHEIRMLKEKSAVQLQQLVEEKIRKIEALEAKMTSMRYIAQQERMDSQTILEHEREAQKKVKAEVRHLNEHIKQIEQKNLELQAKNIFLKNELERALKDRHEANVNLQSSRRASASPFSSNATAADAASDPEFVLEAVIEMCEDLCDSMAPTIPTTTVPGQNTAGLWTKLYDRCKDNPTVDGMELCLLERIGGLSYDASQLHPERSSGDLPFPKASHLPDAADVSLAANVVFSVVPPNPTVIMRRSEPERIAEVRDRIIDTWTRARQMDSLRTKVVFDCVRSLLIEGSQRAGTEMDDDASGSQLDATLGSGNHRSLPSTLRGEQNAMSSSISIRSED